MSDVDYSGMVLNRAESLGFSDSDELVDTALKTFLASRPDLRLELAVSLYREGEVSLSRAVEISGLKREEFKKVLCDRDVVRSSSSINGSIESFEEYKG